MNAARQFLLLPLFCLSLNGCQTVSYYSQAVSGQIEILQKAQPVEELVSSEYIEPELRNRLLMVEKIRNFALVQLGLKGNKSFSDYVNLDRRFVVWNVFSSPKLSLEAEEWCFLIAGCVSYRGYFDLEDANEYAQKERDRGKDAIVLGASAYSTIGWFRDPILNTFIDYPNIELVRLIFHELAHQIIYVKNDTVFNESLAVAVEEEGVRRWLEEYGEEKDKKDWIYLQLIYGKYEKLFDSKRKKLEKIYASDRSEVEKLNARETIFNELREEYDNINSTLEGASAFKRLVASGINNAFFIPLETYSKYVPFFTELIENEEDFENFFQKVKHIAQQSRKKREVLMGY